MRTTFCQTTIDPVFKYLMSKKVVRNGLLSAILNEPITDSELIDDALNPLPAYRDLRTLVNRSDVQALMEQLSDLPKDEVLDRKIHRTLINQALSFIHELAPCYFELSSALPMAERQTSLDIVCETSYGLVEVEVQISPQNYWDLRILDHVCGLFHRQFSRGFKWSDLEKDPRLNEQVRRVAGVSIFEKPPRFPENVQVIFPWYNAASWGKEELKRHYRLCDQSDLSVVRPGIEFFDFNLEAYLILNAKHLLGNYSKDLCEWLEFFAAAHTKTESMVAQAHYSPEVQEAYDLVKTLPPDIDSLYEEALLRQANISHYAQSMKEEGLVEGKAEGLAEGKAEGLAEGKAEGLAEGEVKLRAEKMIIAKNLMNKGFTVAEIIDITGLSVSEISELKA